MNTKPCCLMRRKELLGKFTEKVIKWEYEVKKKYQLNEKKNYLKQENYTTL